MVATAAEADGVGRSDWSYFVSFIVGGLKRDFFLLSLLLRTFLGNTKKRTLGSGLLYHRYTALLFDFRDTLGSVDVARDKMPRAGLDGRSLKSWLVKCYWIDRRNIA